jgi:predicted acylesterase/phospholipase RssA
MTLAQFHQATGRELGLVASDTTGQRMLVLNHRTAPDCPVVWAVRMSMSIPLVWQEVEWLPEWGRYNGQDIAGHLIVDGGMLSNFPIELLVSDEPFVTAVMGPAVAGKVIGLLIDDSLPVPDAPPPPEKPVRFDFGRLKTISRFKGLIDTMTNAHDKEVIDSLRNLVARLPAQGYGTTEFDMSPERREALVRAGHTAMEEYLARRQAIEAMESGALLPAGAAAIAARIAGRILGVARP